MTPSLPRAVIFDWDNTLVDVWGSVTDAVNAVRAAFGQEPPWTAEETRGHSARSARSLFLEWYGDEWPKAHKIFYDHYQQSHLLHIRPLPFAEELLLWLKAQNIPSFVVSNKRGEILRQEAAHLGWTDFFASMVGSMDAPRDKPERDPVDMALNHAQLKADDPSIWFVGDTCGDVECARNAGCTPVIVYDFNEAKRLGVDLAFSDCQALLELFNNMTGAGANPAAVEK